MNFTTHPAEPRASLLIESMRDIGYSLETALADIIDNSISAGATRVDILSECGDIPRIGVLDNGSGMSRDTLMEAMRPGSRNPLDSRDPKDLGRFGLGLKTASLSQCRRLTVITRHGEEVTAARWDLDFVSEQDQWIIQIPNSIEGIPWSDRLRENGTLVLWEYLDRVVDNGGSDAGYAHFNRRIDEAREHLELVFHRFLAGEGRTPKVEIYLNNRQLIPFDPFNARHSATVIDPEEVIKVSNGIVRVQTFTLPHHKKAGTEDWEKYAGREGYLKNQGFYVYRQKRLIIYGTWFGLAKQTELTKLARVRIDMPNDLDAQWKIDVKKASAQPPAKVRERLRYIIERIGATSKRVYTSRGKKLVTDNRLPVWNRIVDKDRILYRVNKEHPVVADFMADLDEVDAKRFSRILELTETALPLDMVFADVGNAPDQVGPEALSEEVLADSLHTLVARLTGSGIPMPTIKDMLKTTEPYKSDWERSKQILESMKVESD
ncbi:MAG: ATP-binding protein [Planctomycetota bacterium]